MNEKDNKKLIRWILSLMVIVVLFIPAIAVYEIEARTETNVLAVEGLYTNGTVITTYEPIDMIQVPKMYSGETITLTQANNDSYYIKDIVGFAFDIAYTNFVSYVGNGTYNVAPNYTIHTDVPPANVFEIAIPLNITTHELAEFDFIRLYSNSEHTWQELIFRTPFLGNHDRLYFDLVRNNTYIIVISLSTKTALLSAPDEMIYVLDSDLDKTDVTWNFKVVGFNLDEIHQFSWSDNQLYIVSLLIVSAILTPLAILSSKVIDLKIDKGKPGGNR